MIDNVSKTEKGICKWFGHIERISDTYDITNILNIKTSYRRPRMYI